MFMFHVLACFLYIFYIFYFVLFTLAIIVYSKRVGIPSFYSVHSTAFLLHYFGGQVSWDIRSTVIWLPFFLVAHLLPVKSGNEDNDLYFVVVVVEFVAGVVLPRRSLPLIPVGFA